MSFRQGVSRIAAAIVIACTALASVGLTAPVDSAFSIRIRPVLIRLAVEVDVRFGSMHLHTRWSALPESAGT